MMRGQRRKREALNSKRAESKAQIFNAEYPIGSRVIYRPIIGRDDGMRETLTRSEAYVAASGMPVVFVEGVAGCVALGAVSPIK